MPSEISLNSGSSALDRSIHRLSSSLSNSNQQPQSVSISNQSQNNQSVPEPSEVIGNLLALICLVLFFTRKRWHHLLKALLQKKV